MGGNRTLLIVVVLLLIFGVGGYAAWMFLKGGPEPTVEVPVTPEVSYTSIVVAVQNIPRGMTIRQENMAIELQEWPNDHLPVAFYTDMAEVDGKMARTDIPLGIPIMPDMIVKPGDSLSAEGSPASVFSPQDRVAYAIPMDLQGGVAWAIRPGDHVDVIAAVKLLAVDPEFQSQFPNQFLALPQTEDEDMFSGIYGRFETLPNGQPAVIFPTGEMQSNLAVQMTVQDAIVWKVGIWPSEAEENAAAVAANATPAADAAPASTGLTANPTPTPAPVSAEKLRDNEPVTLLVKRDEVLVLKYLYEIGADLDLVLRPAGFTEPVMQTQPVWLRYVIDKYQLPDTSPDLPIVPITIHPPITLKVETPTPASE